MRSLVIVIAMQLICLRCAFAYLDPGSGSYIFQVLIATVIGGLFAIKVFWQKIRSFLRNRFSKREGPATNRRQGD